MKTPSCSVDSNQENYAKTETTAIPEASDFRQKPNKKKMFQWKIELIFTHRSWSTGKNPKHINLLKTTRKNKMVTSAFPWYQKQKEHLLAAYNKGRRYEDCASAWEEWSLPDLLGNV